MRPLFDDNNLPINHVWGIVQSGKENAHLRIFPQEEVFGTRQEAREYIKKCKRLWKYKSLRVRKLYLNV